MPTDSHRQDEAMSEKDMTAEVQSSSSSQHSNHTSTTAASEDLDNGLPPSTGQERPIELARTVTGPPHSIFTTNQKRFIVFMASWAGFFSPVSGQIYFPALNSLARDLNVSNSLINLTLTSYMIFQGLAPSIIGSLADTSGRRVAYAICFIVYIAANVGLALQDSYAALFVLRCIQSSGSSGTIAMASGVVSDIATASERGSYMGYTLAGSLLGPAVGPVLGGILAQFLGWRAIFWFLTIMGAAFLVVFAIFFPETARTQVGNGSIPPKGWNMSLMNYLAVRKARQESNNELEHVQSETVVPPKPRSPNPLASLKMLLDKENALLLFYNAFLFCAFYDITATIPSQFAKKFGFNDLQIGLCYIPFGAGSMLAALLNGQFLDRNFCRWCTRLQIPIQKNRNTDLSSFPIEKVRLQIALPAVYVCATMVLIFGWVLDYNGPLAGLLVVLFFTSLSMSIAFNCTSTLLVDFYPQSPATATAANNLVRCLLGAGATALVIPMVKGMGLGGTFTLLGVGLWVTSPMLWLVYFKGMGWRVERRRKENEEERTREGEKAGSEEKAHGGEVQGGVVEAVAVAEEEKEMNEMQPRREKSYPNPLARTLSHQSGC